MKSGRKFRTMRILAEHRQGSIVYSMRFSRDAVRCAPASRLASKSASTSAKIAAHSTFARRRNAARFRSTQKPQAEQNYAATEKSLAGMLTSVRR
jgi:hypothetical protein